jgi:transposase-like protein
METSSKAIAELARDLGVNDNNLYRWRGVYGNQAQDSTNGSKAEMEAELKRLRRDILKHIMRSQVQATCFINLRVFARPETSNSKMGDWHP